METKVSDLKSLRERITFLKSECRVTEEKITNRIHYYQDNAGAIVIETLVKSFLNMNLNRWLSSWLSKENDKQKKDAGGASKNEWINTLITLGLSLGMKYFNKFTK